MAGLSLHKKFGVNPRMTNLHCQCCGGVKKGESILLLGAANYHVTCPHCGVRVYGGIGSGKQCPKCGVTCHKILSRTELREGEQIDTTGICQECRGWMKQGIVLISVRDDATDKPNPEDVYRTGCIAVVKDDAIKRMLGGSPELLQKALSRRMLFVHDGVWDKVGLPRENSGEKEEASDETTS